DQYKREFPRCPTCNYRLLPPENSPKYASAPPADKCWHCWQAPCDVCHSSPRVVDRMLRDPRAFLGLLHLRGLGYRVDVEKGRPRPSYIPERVDLLRLCHSCDARLETAVARLKQDIAPQRAVGASAGRAIGDLPARQPTTESTRLDREIAWQRERVR